MKLLGKEIIKAIESLDLTNTVITVSFPNDIYQDKRRRVYHVPTDQEFDEIVKRKESTGESLYKIAKEYHANSSGLYHRYKQFRNQKQNNKGE